MAILSKKHVVSSTRKKASCLLSMSAFLALGTLQGLASTTPLIFYVPFPEADYLAGLQAIESGGSGNAPANPVTTFITIAAVADATIVRYDRWADGYDAAGDYDPPLQPTTEVWGDNNPANGIPPGFASDLINAGSVIILSNQVDTTISYSATNGFFLARDRIAANKMISVTRTFWASDSDTLMAGSMEVFDKSLWGTEYRVPIGENIPDGTSTNDGDHQMFEYTGISIMAAEDGTVVWVDKDANGIFETTNTLNRGQGVFINGGVNVGGHVVASKPVQVVMLSGDKGSNYESRDSSLLPVSRWSDNYYTPVSTEFGAGTRVWLYNPDTSTSVAVFCDYRVGTNGITRSNSTVVAANSYASVLLPEYSAAHFYTTNSPRKVFYAYSTTDSDTVSTGGNQAWDWSFTLIPHNLLSPQLLLGLGIGRDPHSAVNPSENGNPMWVTPVGNGDTPITVYVDYDGDNAGPLTDPYGFHYDTNFPLRELQQQLLYDSDGDQSGMLAYVLSTNVTLAGAWGQDPRTATAAAPGLDAGTSIPPEDVIEGWKDLIVVGDVNGDGQLGPRDRAEYVIEIGNNTRAIIPTGFQVRDIVPTNTTYVTNSTAYSTNSAVSWIPVPDDLTGTPFPLDGTGLVFNITIDPNYSLSVRFQVDVNAYTNLGGATSITNSGSIESLSYNRTTYFENITPLHGSIGDRVWSDVNTNGVPDVGESGIGGVVVYLDVNTNGVLDVWEPRSMTDIDGNYLLTGPYLLAGTHLVRVDTNMFPAGTVATYDLDGTSTLSRASVVLTGGQDRVDADFGYRLPPNPSSIVKTSGAGPQGLAPGQTNTYTISISNTGAVTQTGVEVTDILPATLTYVPGSVVVVSPSVLTNTVRDNFSVNAYTNNNGSTNWAGAWTETNDDDSATAGDVRVTGGQLRFHNSDNGIRRSANLAGSASAVFSFVYSTSGNLEASDVFTVQVATNAAGPYTNLQTFAGNVSGTASYDISAYASTGTTVRFMTTGFTGGGANPEYFFVDNAQIQFVKYATVTNAGGAPPNLATNYTLPPGQAMTVTFKTVVTNVLPPGVVAITNTAGVLSDQYSLWAYASVQDPVPRVTIGDFAWVDTNGNGQQDGGEPGLSNVTVRLYDAASNLIATATTATNGYYAFTNLTSGTYSVGFEPPAGYLSTTSNVGADATDSDPLAGTNRTADFAVISGETNNTIDAGFYQTGSIAGSVLVDVNGNGVVEGGDTNPIANVTVRLLDAASNVVATTTTSVGGAYSFTNLPPGSYAVVQVLPSGYTNTFDTTGPNDLRIPVTLTSGQNSTGNNFYDAGYGVIGDFAWADTNGNGRQDGGEPGLFNVTVRLYDAATNLVATTVTATNGLYAFTNVLPGTYNVSFTPPAGYLFTTPDVGTDAGDSDPVSGAGLTASFSLSADETNNTIDAGFYLPSALGDRVWLDENGDGVQDAGEDGIANVRVILYTTNGVALATNVTDNEGRYLYTGLMPCPYVVRVDTNSMSAGLAVNQTYDPDSTTNHETTVTLQSGQEVLTADFGYNWASIPEVKQNTGTGAIGDRIWVDANGNGAQDPGEPGIPNVTVRLYSDAAFNGNYTSLVATATTDAAGNYIFDGLAAGAYVIEVNGGAAPAGTTQTGDPDYFATPLPASARDNRTTAPILLAPGDVFVNADFGYQPDGGTTGSIGDRVWFDANANGALDWAEVGIPGVSVALIRDSNGNGVWNAGEAIIATTATSTNGTYGFAGLPVTDGAGTDDYLVWVNDTAGVLIGLSATYDNDGAAPATGIKQGYGISRVQDLTTAGNMDQDFGYTAAGQTPSTGLIGDTIFMDRDANGSPGSGEGLEGVTVLLFDSSGTTLLATTVTDENGRYAFGGLNTNSVTYMVRVTTNSLPNGGAGLSNTVDPDAGTANESIVMLTGANPIRLDQDFGYRFTVNPNSIGGTLWEDLNTDGTLVAGETSRFSNVTVILADTNGNLVATTTTDSNGNFSFNNLPDGTYVVDVTDDGNLLNGYWHSLGGAPGVDSNSQYDAYTVTVSGGQNNTTADFGYFVKPAALGNRVWFDANKDGVQDPGETGLNNVRVILRIAYSNGTTNVVSMLTDTNGYYGFANLLLDENFDGVGAGEPAYTLSVVMPGAKVGLTLVGVTNLWLDSNSNATVAVAAKGLTSVGLLANPANESTNATYDFGLVWNQTLARLIGFRAFSRDGAVVVSWETSEELDTAGFYLERLAGDQYRSVNDEFIPSYEMGGGVYEQVDPSAQAGGSYTYRLIELETSGNRLYLGPYVVTVDGLALSFDEWSRSVFSAKDLFSPAVSGAEADPDGDGMNNLAEFRAGTNPTSKDSALRIRALARTSASAFSVIWLSESNRVYTLERAAQSMQGFQPVASGIRATPPENTFLDLPPQQADDAYFYRIKLE